MKVNVKLLLSVVLLISGWSVRAQDADPSVDQKEAEAIEATLMDYIDGTADGDHLRIQNAFHKDLNLYTIDQDTLKVISGRDYISYFKDGKKRNRIGKIISVDRAGDGAMAEIEVRMPAMKRIYTDYLLLLRIEGQWKIIHKSFTYREE